MRFQVGDGMVEVLVDIDRFQLPIAQFLPEADPERVESARSLLEPDHADLDRGLLTLAIQTFVLRAAGRTILVDTCVGEGKERPILPDFHRRHRNGFLERLAQAGVQPESIDLVFCTHLHVDHVGWNTRLLDGRWVPTFPNARYLIGRHELGYWQDQRRRPDGDALQLGGFEDIVLPILEAGRAELVDDGYELGPGLELVPLPGHTPGQMGCGRTGRSGPSFARTRSTVPCRFWTPDCQPRGVSIGSRHGRSAGRCSRRRPRRAGWWWRHISAARAACTSGGRRTASRRASRTAASEPDRIEAE
jgi:glyoxylase-like metal-dependent hydrolase (beta-lactamase superfamily II)